MTVEPAVPSDALEAVRASVDDVLGRYLEDCARDLGRIDPLAPLLIDEISRSVFAGGKRLRPAFCIWAYRAAGERGSETSGALAGDVSIVRAAAALELLHTMALIHDDLMDASAERRGVASSAPHLAGEAVDRGFPVDADRFGNAAAMLTGDLANVLADRLLLTSGFDAAAIARALAPYHEMRLDMAAGQLLDVAGLARQPATARHAARLKGGSYTVEGPMLVGAALAGDRADVRSAMRAFGRPLGEAFQLRDDLHDRDGTHAHTSATVNELVAEARASLIGTPLDPVAAAALDELAALVAMA
jgi:geranylgeranyl diphosphate synthase type I